MLRRSKSKVIAMLLVLATIVGVSQFRQLTDAVVYPYPAPSTKAVAQANYNMASAALEAAKIDYTAAQDAYIDAKNELESQVDSYREFTINSCSEEIENLNRATIEYNKAKDAQKNAQVAFDEAKADRENIEARIAELEGEIHGIPEELSKTVEEKLIAEAGLSAKKTELEQASANLDAAMVELEQANVAKNEAKAALDCANEAVANINSTINRLDEEIARLQANLEACSPDSEEYEITRTELETAQAAVASAETELTAKQVDANEKKLALDTANANLADAESRCTELRELIDSESAASDEEQAASVAKSEAQELLDACNQELADIEAEIAENEAKFESLRAAEASALTALKLANDSLRIAKENKSNAVRSFIESRMAEGHKETLDAAFEAGMVSYGIEGEWADYTRGVVQDAYTEANFLKGLETLELINKFRATEGATESRREPYLFSAEAFYTEALRMGITVGERESEGGGLNHWGHISVTGLPASYECLGIGHSDAEAVLATMWTWEKENYETGNGGETGHYKNLAFGAGGSPAAVVWTKDRGDNGFIRIRSDRLGEDDMMTTAKVRNAYSIYKESIDNALAQAQADKSATQSTYNAAALERQSVESIVAALTSNKNEYRNNKIPDATRALEAAVQKLIEVQSLHATATSTLNSYRDSHPNEVADYNRLPNLRNSVEQAENQYEDAQSAVSVASLKLDEMKSLEADAMNKLDGLDSKAAATKAAITEAQDRRLHEQRNLIGAKEEVAAAEIEHNTAIARSNEKAEKYAIVSSLVSSLEGEVSSLNNKLLACEEVIASLAAANDEVFDLAYNLNEAINNYNSTKATLEDADRVLEQKTDSMAAAQNEYDRIHITYDFDRLSTLLIEEAKAKLEVEVIKSAYDELVSIFNKAKADLDQKIKEERTVGKVTGLKVVAGKKKATVSYSKGKNVTGYVIYRSTKKSSGFKKVATTKYTSWTNKSLKKGKTYYFKVKAYRVVEGKTYYSSSWSSTVKVKVK